MLSKLNPDNYEPPDIDLMRNLGYGLGAVIGFFYLVAQAGVLVALQALILVVLMVWGIYAIEKLAYPIHVVDEVEDAP